MNFNDYSLILKSDLTLLADSIRSFTGETGPLTVPQMAAFFESSELVDLLNSAIDTVKSIVESKGATLVIPNYVTSVGQNAFYGRQYLKSVTIPQSVTFLGVAAFDQCKVLESVTINGEALTEIEDNCFRGCLALKNMYLPKSVDTLGRRCFSGCSALESIYVSDARSIDQQAFENCSACTLFDFTRNTSVPVLQNANAFSGINPYADIVVPDELYDAWVSATNWVSLSNFIIKASEVPPT